MSASEPVLPLERWLRKLTSEGLTGRLQAEGSGAESVLYFVSGRLYVAPDHPAARLAREWLARGSGSVGVETAKTTHNVRAAQAGESPTGELGAAVRAGTWDKRLESALQPTATSQGWRFQAGAGQLRSDLTGPLPVVPLVMNLAVRGRRPPELLQLLGGRDATLLAAQVPVGTAAEALTEDEHAVLNRLRQPMKVGEIFGDLPVSEDSLLTMLCRLQEGGFIVQLPDKTQAGSTDRAAEATFHGFLARIGEDLRRRLVGVDRDAHREFLANLLGRIGDLTYFDLLAVTAESSEQDVYDAYLELARLVHPDNARALGLDGKEGALRLLFERATEAYLTLSDPERRLRYASEFGYRKQRVEDGLPPARRVQEQREIARRNFEVARAAAERQDFHTAIQLLEQIVKSERRAEYFALLADCQSENPQWLDRAVGNYSKAVDLESEDPVLRLKLGRALERLRRREDAIEVYSSILERWPDSQAAVAAMLRLGGSPSASRAPSVWDRILLFLRLRQ